MEQNKQQNIICLANTTWYGEYTKSTVQIMSRLAKNHRIIFVEYPFTVKDLLTTILKKQNAPISKMLGIETWLEKVETDQNSQVFNLTPPPVLPVDFIKNDRLFNLFFNLNIIAYRKRLKKAIKKLNFKNPIVITAYNPFYGLKQIGKLNEKLNIYYCYDGIGTRRHGQRIFKMDEMFSKSVDGIITTSDQINSDKLKFNSKSFVVKNGVDIKVFEPFAKTKPHKRDKKIVGYIGSLDHRFDIENIEKAIQLSPDLEFHFTGNLRNMEIKDRLNQFKNVQFFNSISPNKVPKLLSSYDVGIIPYIVNEINKNIYPLKINEYLAVGVPIVMTPFASLSDFKDLVSIAKTPQELSSALKIEVESDSSEKIKQRIAFAKNNSWENRTKEFDQIIKNLS